MKSLSVGNQYNDSSRKIGQLALMAFQAGKQPGTKPRHIKDSMKDGEPWSIKYDHIHIV